MNTAQATKLKLDSAEPLAQIEAACQAACEAIAPTWPLDQSIAVNPHWKRINRPVREVAARMAVLGGIDVFPPRAMQKAAWQAGRVTRDDLAQALTQVPAAQTQGLTVQDCIAAVAQPSAVQALPLLIDVLDNDPKRHTRLSWRQAITHQVSQTCAAYFDQHQADWQPSRKHGLYQFWRDTLRHDHGIGLLMGLPRLGQAIQALPAQAHEAESWVMQRLGLPPAVWADYLESVLLTVNGWASWCAYLNWQAQLAGQSDSHLRELLAIRLAWGVLLLEGKDDSLTRKAFAALQSAWTHVADHLQQAQNALVMDEVWQVALEWGYQRTLLNKLQSVSAPVAESLRPEVQAAFCIDVRSEPLRRALEAVWPAIQTVGFAGFFGLPIAYTPVGTTARRPQLPGLLAPAMEVSEGVGSVNPANTQHDLDLQKWIAESRQHKLATQDRWQTAAHWPAAAFSTVEAAGLGYLAKLTQWVLPARKARARDDLAGLSVRYQALCKPRLMGVTLEQKVALAVQVVSAMGLKGQLAPLVLLVGHGGQSANNAHAAGLDCGACCGQTGEVNARALAQLLNDPEVRAALNQTENVIPSDTWFVAALHNTTTDELETFDVQDLSEPAYANWLNLQPMLVQALDQVRRERAVGLGLNPRAAASDLLKTLQVRANDGAQTRPEWGLAGNAAFVIAPRHRTQGAVLNGRAFLHDYNPATDTDGKLLELLMTAPMLVTHWINWQYHASTCEPLRYGSGNKVLHNVVGGTLGVFEGNGGDLRIGLSKQSLHNGSKWVHEPLRLTVVIDAPRDRIEGIVAQHAAVSNLINHNWLTLWRFAENGLEAYREGTWRPVMP